MGLNKTQIALRALLAGAALSTMAFALVACGDDDDSGAKAQADVKAAVDEEIAGEKAGDVDKVLNHVTDNWLKTVVGATRDEVKANPGRIQSDDQPKVGAIKVNGNKATAEALQDAGKLDYRNSVDLVKDGGVWKLDKLHMLSAATVPSGSKKVNVDLTEFAFGFNRKDVTSNQTLVFHVENQGKQPHMMDLSKIPADADLQKLFASEGDGPPPGVEEIGTAFLFSPGDKADVVLKEKLAPGRYVMLCFVGDQDDPEHTPHALKGMVADFTVE